MNKVNKVLSEALREGVIRYATPREIGSLLTEYRSDLSGAAKIQTAKNLAQERRVLAWADHFDPGRGYSIFDDDRTLTMRYGTAQIRLVAAEMAAWNENVLKFKEKSQA